MLANLLSRVDHEVFLLTAQHEGRRSGMVVTWLMPATLVVDRPRIVAVLSVNNYTYELIVESGGFVAHLLAEGQHRWLERFGLQSGMNVDKFEGLELRSSPSGHTLVEGTCGWMDCAVVSHLALGDRMLVVADVLEQEVAENRRALLKSESFKQLEPEIIRALETKRERDGERDRELIKGFGRNQRRSKP